MMHIFLSRAKGGKGDKRNGCLGCVSCHQIIDNPLGDKQNELSKEYLVYCKQYLKEKENIQDEKKLIDDLKFKKAPIRIELIKKELIYKRCKNCKMLIKKNI